MADEDAESGFDTADLPDQQHEAVTMREALRQREALLRLALEGGQMGSWRWNLREDLITGDATFLELWGFPPSNEPRPLSDFAERMSAAGQAEMSAMVSRALDAGEHFDGQLEVISGPSQGRWVRWRGIAETERSWIINGVSFDVTEQRRAETRMASDLEDATLLRDLAARLVTEESAGKVHDEILAAALTIARADAGTLQIYNSDTHTLNLLVTQNFSRAITDHFLQIEAGSRTACGIALRTGEIAFADFADDAEDTSSRLHVSENIRSALAMPLVSRTGEPLGMLKMHWREFGHRPSARQMGFLDLLARQAADLIDQTRTRTELRESEERQAFLLTLSDTLRPLTDASEVERQATRMLGEHLQADRCFLSPVYEDGQGMCVREEYLRTGASSVLGDYTFAQFGDFVGPELHAGRILAVEDVSALIGLSETERASYAATQIAAYLLIPLVRNARLAAFLTINHRTPRTWSEEDKAIASQTADRLWAARERARAEGELRESEQRFREFGEKSSDVLWIVDLETMRLEYLSPAYERIWGEPREVALSDYSHWARTLHPEDRDEAMQAMPRLMAGEPYVADYRIVRTTGEVRAIRDTGFPMRNAHGQITRAGGIAQDITDIRAAGERRQLLLAELQHRVRNILGMVRSMARQSIKPNQTADEYLGHLIGRIDAIARTQVLLTRAPDAGVDLEGLVREELLAHGGDRDFATVDGPPIFLSPKAAEVLTLTIHELATNSVKYGVLGECKGKLAVRWERSMRDSEDWLTLHWRERCDTPRAAKGQDGFGTELIERRVAYELRGEGSLDIGPDDVRAEIAFPLRDASSLLETGAQRVEPA